MSVVVGIIGHEVLDSRGNPTVEYDVLLESGVMGCAVVSSGASIGLRETIELRGGDKSCYLGKGVPKVVEHINTEISEVIMGLDVSEQAFLGRTLVGLDGTENKSRLGASTILVMSMAAAKVAAEEAGLPLHRYFGGSGTMQMSVSMVSIVNNDVHANNSLGIQELMVMPVGQLNFRETLRCGAEIFHALKRILAGKGMNTAVGDEGGFVPNFVSSEECLNTVLSTIEQIGYEVGRDVLLALDCAASEFYKDSKYHLEDEGPQPSSGDFTNYLADLADKFPIVLIEDDAHKSGQVSWKALTEKLGKKTQLAGSDLFITNTKILREGAEKDIVNSILTKINQISMLTGTFAVIETVKRAGYTTVISHRSGGTEDSVIADIAVGTDASQIRTGSLSWSNHTAKYSQLLRIEEDLDDIVNYPGKSAFYNLR